MARKQKVKGEIKSAKIMLVIISFVFFLFLGIVPKDSGLRSFGTTFFKWVLCKFLWDFIVNIGIKSWDRSFGLLFGPSN